MGPAPDTSVWRPLIMEMEATIDGTIETIGVISLWTEAEAVSMAA